MQLLARSNADLVMVLILSLIVFNSGGVRIVDNYLLTILVYYLITIKVLMERCICYDLLLLLSLLGILIVGFNYGATNLGFSPKNHLVFFSYILTGALVTSVYARGRSHFIDDLYLTMKVYLVLGLFGVLLMPIAASKGMTLFMNYGEFIFAGHVIPRNASVFWEPGVFQIFMNILFYLALFVFKEKRVVSLSAIAILSSLSTAGYLILALQIAWYYLSNIKRMKGLRIMLVLILACLMLTVASAVLALKMTGEQSKSSRVRMLDWIVGISIIQEHPLIGIGMNDNRFKQTYEKVAKGHHREYMVSSSEIEGKGLSNGVLYLLATFGIPLAILMLYLLSAQAQIPGILFLLILLLSALSEPIIQTPFYALFMAFGFCKIMISRRLLLSPPVK